MRLSARRVRKFRKTIQRNRCENRPGLTHDYFTFYVVKDATTLAPPAEEITICRKCERTWM